MSTKQVVSLITIWLVGSPLLSLGQTHASSPQLVELVDTILLSAIKRYQISITPKEVMVVSLERHQDTVKYYITAINSMYRLTRNMPVIYTKLANHYILLYSGIEQSVKANSGRQTQFLSLFRSTLRYDLLADGKTWDPMSVGNYDPIQVLLISKAGKLVYENFKKGFGPAGIPFLDMSR